MKPRLLKIAGKTILTSLPVLLLGILPASAFGQIIVNDGNGLGQFSACGFPVNTNFVTGLNEPQGIATDGTNLFAANFGAGTIGKYTLSGDVVNTNLISGVSSAEGIALGGTNLFVATYNGIVGEYTTSGTTIKSNLISGPGAMVGVAVSGTNLFVSASSGVYKFSTSGTAVNSFRVQGLHTPTGLAIGGTNLFVAELFGNTVREYTFSGTPVSTNLVNVTYPNGIAINGDRLFVIGLLGVVGEYTTSGATINPSLFSVPNYYGSFGIIIAPNTGPSVPTTLAMGLTGTIPTVSWSTNAFAYEVQSSLSLVPAIWTVVTNTPVVTNGNFNISLSPTNQAQFFRLRSIN